MGHGIGEFRGVRVELASVGDAMIKIKHTHLHDRKSNATILLRVSIYLPLTKPA